MICDGQKEPVYDFKIIWTNPNSLHNWTEQLDLICYPSWHIGAAGTAYFWGWASTILIVPKLADKYGRKWVYTLSVIMSIIMMLMLIYVS